MELRNNDEVWVVCKEPHSKYEASSYGKIRNKQSKKILSQRTSFGGYCDVSFSFKDYPHRRTYRVHRIIYEAFYQDFDRHDTNITIDHIDYNPSNNQINNLRIMTKAEMAKSHRVGFKQPSKYRKINQFTMDGTFIKTYDTFDAIEKDLKIDVGHIYDCCNNKRKSSYGFKWRYIEQEDISGEVWKELSINNTVINISNMGRFKTNKTKTITYGTTDNGGYKRAKFNGRSYSMHYLVATAFLSPRPSDEHIINHIDENKENNCAANLEWVTNSQNVKHSSYRYCKAVRATQILTKQVKEFVSAREASKILNVPYGYISAVCNNYRGAKSAHGYKFEFINKKL